MYWEHFGFSEQPFALTPNPEFLFLSSHHQEAFAHLLYGIDTRTGFIVLSGEVGTGKTTIIRTLLNQLSPDTHRTALIFNPTLSPLGLLQEINREFSLPCTSRETRELLDALNAFLLEENRAGRTVVLVIDEAQNLSPEVLEQIRLISNLETERAKLIQIVLVGQPELKRLLARQELRQLHQRITVSYHLEPMEYDDTRDYIRHRIRVAAGGREPLSFTTGAVKRIFRFSGGLPRLINGVCDRALLLAYTKETTEISPAMATQAIADIRKDERRPATGLRFAARVSLIAIALAGATAGVVAVSHHGTVPQLRKPEAKAELPLAREAALADLAGSSERDNLFTALNAVLRAWQAPPASPPPGPSPDIRALARQRGLTVTEIAGTLDTLTQLDAPALLHVPLPEGGTRLVALAGYDNGRFTVVPSVAGRSSVTKAELASIWNGRATLLWKNFHGITPRLKPGSTGKGVKPLQELLKGAGFYDGNASGIFDAKTEEAVRSFQQAESLEADGKPGEKTLLLLYRRAGGFFPPGLSRGGDKPRSNGGHLKDGERTTKNPDGEHNG